jgi:hypothetical protein
VLTGSRFGVFVVYALAPVYHAADAGVTGDSENKQYCQVPD